MADQKNREGQGQTPERGGQTPERGGQTPERGSETGTQTERQQQGQPRREEQGGTGNQPKNPTQQPGQGEQTNR